MNMFDVVDGSAIALAGRLLLDGAGLLFGLYVITMAGLWSRCRLLPLRHRDRPVQTPSGTGDIRMSLPSDR
ncbi:MAG: hypothetical protein IPJ14_14070 [Kineosporiaceae bacterium]|nr:hypothetical protein [Kineosporiaceae bacterium]MBK8075691.1 hypothetical protein [Kineosporiaceae bacterium]